MADTKKLPRRRPRAATSVPNPAQEISHVKTKELLRQHNLPTLPHVSLCRQTLYSLQPGDIPLPATVRNPEGRSFGLVRTHSELATTARAALLTAPEILVERHIPGRRFAITFRQQRMVEMAEISRHSGTPGALSAGPPLSSARRRGIEALAMRAQRVLARHSATRVELLLNETENEYILDVQTMPRVTPYSVLTHDVEVAA